METKQTKTVEERAIRQRKIVENKERAKKRDRAKGEQSPPIPVVKQTKSRAEAKTFIAILQGRRAQLIKELGEIGVALNVIKKAYE